jgi:hypothetical protein
VKMRTVAETFVTIFAHPVPAFPPPLDGRLGSAAESIQPDYVSWMLRLISSLLVLLLGTAASPARGARRRASLRPRWRQRPDDDGAADRALEAMERPRSRAKAVQWSWPGSVELVHGTHTVQVPGTWTLDAAPFYRRDSATMSAMYEAARLPGVLEDGAAWAARMRRVLSFQEPGTRLRVGAVNASGWQTLEVAVPTRPPTVVQVDRDALGSLLDGAVTVSLRING